MVVSSSSRPVKRRPGRPLGSKNKPKLFALLTIQSADTKTVRHSTPLPLLANVFSFLAITGA
jgi:hypothetical protein